MKKIKKITIIGCGHIGERILSQIKEKSFSSCSFIITRRNKKAGKAIAKKYKVEYCNQNSRAVTNADVVWLCVRPNQMTAAIKEIKSNLKENCIIFSVAVAISRAYIAKLLPKQNIIIYMPSPLFNINQGVALISGLRDSRFKSWQNILKKWSSDLIIVKDKDMHLFTTITSCSSAFYAAILNLLFLGSKKIQANLNDKKLKSILALVGAETLFYLKDKDIKEIQTLIKNAATPGGMTEAGLRTLNATETKRIFERFIRATVLRAKTLQKSNEK